MEAVVTTSIVRTNYILLHNHLFSLVLFIHQPYIRNEDNESDAPLQYAYEKTPETSNEVNNNWRGT